MRFFTQVIFTMLITLAAFSVVTYTACKQDKCKGIVCLNGGACQDGACVCPSAYNGTHCENTVTPPDPCAGVTCQNGGTCSGGSCTCLTGFEGTHCETIIRDKFVGTWVGSDVCTSGPYNGITMVITPGNTDVQVSLKNPGGFGTNINIIGSATTSTTLKFANQTATTGVVINGTITLNNANAITFKYTATDATTTDSCQGTYTRQ